MIRTDPTIDWARMTDDRPHVLAGGVDYTRSWKKVRRAAGMWAHRNGYSCRTTYDPVSETLTVQFLPREAAWA